MQPTSHRYARSPAQRRENNSSVVTIGPNEIVSLPYLHNFCFYFSPVHPHQFAEVVELAASKAITHAASQNLLSVLYRGDKRNPKQVRFNISLKMKVILILYFKC